MSFPPYIRHSLAGAVLYPLNIVKAKRKRGANIHTLHSVYLSICINRWKKVLINFLSALHLWSYLLLLFDRKEPKVSPSIINNYYSARRCDRTQRSSTVCQLLEPAAQYRNIKWMVSVVDSLRMEMTGRRSQGNDTSGLNYRYLYHSNTLPSPSS